VERVLGVLAVEDHDVVAAVLEERGGLAGHLLARPAVGELVFGFGDVRVVLPDPGLGRLEGGEVDGELGVGRVDAGDDERPLDRTGRVGVLSARLSIRPGGAG
jgi:hypothetical protein